MKRVLVTGATGMLGSYLVRALHADGCVVRAFVRRPERAAWLAADDVELVRGDILDAGAIRRGVDGCDVVFHAAAVIGPEPTWTLFHAGNVVATQVVIDACASAGARLVYVSSTAVYGDLRRHRSTLDESVPLPDLPAGDAYGRSKQHAERLVLMAHACGRAWCTIVRPPTMYGERDRQFVPRIGVVLERGVFPLIAGGRTTLTAVHASAVAAGAIAAARTDCAGGRVYNLTEDFPLTVEGFVRYAGVGLSRRIWAPSIPSAAGSALFRALAVGVWAVGRPELSAHALGSLHWLTSDNPYTAARARCELGWRPTVTPDVGVPQAFRWWKTARRDTERAP